MFKRLRTSVISSWVRPFDSRKERRFARGDAWTLGSERNVSAEDTNSSRMAISLEGGKMVDGVGLERRRTSGLWCSVR